MADFTSQLCAFLSAHPDGMSAREIAKALGTLKGTVNKCLYDHPDLFQKDNSYIPLWTVTSPKKADDPIMLKLQNWSNVKLFSKDDFNALADWDYGSAFIGKYQYITDSGNIIECDSKSEVLLLQYLEENNLVQDVGGQVLKIQYNSAFRCDLDYYPDIVALTKDGHIAVFEVKPVTAMSNHKNMEKYESLAAFCKQKGYLYTMIDPAENFLTYEEICEMQVCSEFLDFFLEWQSEPDTERVPFKYFTDEDVNFWYSLFGEGYTKKEFSLQVHSLIMYYNWYNVYHHGFMAYSRPVLLDNNHNVIDYI